MRYWVEYFGIDGIRLDVAYCLDMDFVRRLRSFTDELGREQGREIFLVGECCTEIITDLSMMKCSIRLLIMSVIRGCIRALAA